MVPQNLTKFTVLIVSLGLILAIAIFRPQVLPEWAERPSELDQVKAKLEKSESEVEQLEAQITELEAEMEQIKAEVSKRESELDQIKAELEERQAELDRLEAELEERQAALNQLKTELDKRVDEIEASELRLAEWEKRTRRLWNWSLAALATSGLLTFISVLAPVVLIQRDRQKRREAQQAEACQISEEEQASDTDGFTPAILVPIQGDNGRSKEGIGINRSGQ